MQILEREHCLRNVDPNHRFWEMSPLRQQREAVPTWQELHDEVKVLFGLKGIIHLHNKWIHRSGKYIAFGKDLADLIFGDEFGFREHFDGVKISSALLARKEYARKPSAGDRLNNFKVGDFGYASRRLHSVQQIRKKLREGTTYRFWRRARFRIALTRQRRAAQWRGLTH